MKRPDLLILGAWLLQATAWFVPVVKLDKFSLSVPGWEAFLSTASELWLSGDTHFTSWYAAVLSAVSVTTTVVFLAASPWVVWRGSRAVQRTSAWIAAAFFVFNAHWFFLLGQDRSDLRSGYFLWWLSFGLLAISLFDLAGWSRVDQTAKKVAAT